MLATKRLPSASRSHLGDDPLSASSARTNGHPTLLRFEIHDYLKTVNGEREVDLPANVAKLLVEFIGDRKTGLLFCTRHGNQLNKGTSCGISTRHLRKLVSSRQEHTASAVIATPIFATSRLARRAF